MNKSAINPPDLNSVDIWQVALDDPSDDINSLIDILDEDELERYHRLHYKFKQRYLISHLACRQILARYTTLCAAEICYQKNTHGKPCLTHDTTLRFNMSHSHDLAIIAISNHAEIGADLEYSEKKTHWDKLARRFFSPEEIDYIFSQPPAEQKSCFFQVWTRKEAFIKALGTGLATPLSSFNTAREQVIELLNTTENNVTWYQKDLKIITPYHASIAQNTPIEKIRYYSYP